MTTQDKRSLKSTAFLSDLISLLNQHSTRWQIVEIDAPASIVSRLTGCGKPSDTLMAFMSWPNFTSLNWPQNDHKFCLAGGNPAPLYVRLRQLTFQSFHINWSKTTHADLHHVSITEFHNLLLEATLLESLFLNFHFDKEDAQNSIRERVNTILYPCLKELSMTFTFSTHDISPLPSLDDIFGPLILPKLQHLEFSRLEIVGLSAALARRSSSLRYLKLAEIPGHHEDVVNELGKLPSVETLEIASFDPHALLQRLAATRDVNYSHAADETFLPNLTALLFTDTTYHRVHWSLFISIFPSTFVEGRRPLRHLEIVAQGRTLSLSAGDIGTTRTYIPKPELEAFQRLIDCGCSLVIRGPDEESKDFIQASRQHHARRLSII